MRLVRRAPTTALHDHRDDPGFGRRLPRRHGGQRGSAGDQRRPERRPGRSAVDRRGLPAGDGRVAPGRGLAGRPVRQAPDLHHRPGSLRHHLSPLWHRAEQRLPDRRARAPGPGRGAPGAGFAGDSGCDLRGRGARPGGGHLDRLDRHRHRDRPGRRRRAGRSLLLAGHLPGQRAADPGDDVDRAALRPRVRRSRGRQAHRLVRDRAFRRSASDCPCTP